MATEARFRSHWNGVRDPMWLYNPYQPLIYLCGLAYGFGPLLGLDRMIQRVNGGWILAIFASIIVVKLVFGLYERLLDARALKTWDIESTFTCRSSFELAGRPAEINRTITLGKSLGPGPRWFRTGLRVNQQWILLAVVLVVLPFLRLFLNVPIETISVVCLSSFATIVLQLALGRMRYLVDGGVLTIQWLSGWTVRQTHTVSLTTTDIRCDFSEGTLALASPTDTLTVALSEMFYPHRFAACVLASSRSHEGSVP